MVDVYQNEYREVHRIWNLPCVNEEIWTNYEKLFGNTGFHEIQLLRRARRALKARFVQFFKEKHAVTEPEKEKT